MRVTVRLLQEYDQYGEQHGTCVWMKLKKIHRPMPTLISGEIEEGALKLISWLGVLFPLGLLPGQV